MFKWSYVKKVFLPMILDDLQSLGLVAQKTHEGEIEQHFKKSPPCVYVGFDPTADSLHCGSLMPLLTLARFQKAGCRIIAVAGGGTALIGDPTGKTDLRKMLTPEQIQINIDGIKKQLTSFLDFSDPQKGILVDNNSWLSKLDYIDFIRDIGANFSVNRMLTAECFKQRLEKGLSFLEFNYMILQAYDFFHLNKEYGCTVQAGGDDQWSNILAGVDLIRRKSANASFGVTIPLLVTSSGKKMGKTEDGAVWIDADKTTPYDFFQYWRNTEDQMVEPCLRYFTFLPLDEIKELASKEGAAINTSKERLAFEVTKIVHGETAAKQALEGAKSMFSTGSAQKSGSVPVLNLARSQLDQLGLVDFMVQNKICKSKSEARRFIEQGGVKVASIKITDIGYILAASLFESSDECLVSRGKKHHYRVVLSD